MKDALLGSLLFAGATVCIAGAETVQAQGNMSFFITSMGKGDGANLGGLAGADAHCAVLAKAAGSTKANWRAYLSATQVPNGAGPVDARDRAAYTLRYMPTNVLYTGAPHRHFEKFGLNAGDAFADSPQVPHIRRGAA